MVRFLLGYYFENMIWSFLLVPLALMLFTIPFSFLSEVRTPFLYTLLIAILLVGALFLEQTIDTQTMLRTMPIAITTIVFVKFLGSALIIGYQLTLIAVILANKPLAELVSTLMNGAILAMIAMNALLLYHFYTGQQKHVIKLAIICFVPLQFAFPYMDALFFTAFTWKSFSLLFLACALTLVNIRLCQRLARLQDHF